MYNGYDFYFKYDNKLLTFPITPSELNIKVGSKNTVVNLINEGDINILKSPSLIEVTFDARFPMRQYPYAREFNKFQTYYDIFKELKESKKSFRFIVVRTTPSGMPTWDTNLLMALEDFELSESVDNGDDVIVSFKLKQYKEYGVRILKKQTKTTSTSPAPRPATTAPAATTVAKKQIKHTIKSGDTLWAIAKKYLGNGNKYTTIYAANKTVIENAAKKHGRSSSQNGHWIYPGTVLTIPT